jgi:hypothetical protein
MKGSLVSAAKHFSIHTVVDEILETSIIRAFRQTILTVIDNTPLHPVVYVVQLPEVCHKCKE